MPIRNQIGVHWLTLDELLAPDHRARQVWSLVEQLDLSALYQAIKATEGRPGHPPGERIPPMTSHPSDRPVSALRARMIEDMSVRGFSEKTRNDYIRHVRAFAAGVRLLRRQR